jgi:hypothetical protein
MISKEKSLWLMYIILCFIEGEIMNNNYIKIDLDNIEEKFGNNLSNKEIGLVSLMIQSIASRHNPDEEEYGKYNYVMLQLFKKYKDNSLIITSELYQNFNKYFSARRKKIKSNEIDNPKDIIKDAMYFSQVGGLGNKHDIIYLNYSKILFCDAIDNLKKSKDNILDNKNMLSDAYNQLGNVFLVKTRYYVKNKDQKILDSEVDKMILCDDGLFDKDENYFTLFDDSNITEKRFYLIKDSVSKAKKCFEKSYQIEPNKNLLDEKIAIANSFMKYVNKIKSK